MADNLLTSPGSRSEHVRLPSFSWWTWWKKCGSTLPTNGISHIWFATALLFICRAWANRLGGENGMGGMLNLPNCCWICFPACVDTENFGQENLGLPQVRHLKPLAIRNCPRHHKYRGKCSWRGVPCRLCGSQLDSRTASNRAAFRHVRYGSPSALKICIAQCRFPDWKQDAYFCCRQSQTIRLKTGYKNLLKIKCQNRYPSNWQNPDILFIAHFAEPAVLHRFCCWNGECTA